MRQLSLDLLGRPPTIDEYRAYQAKGSISEDDIKQMMSSEEFYARMRGYHHALLRSNISASISNPSDTRVSGTGVPKAVNTPFGFRNNTSTGLRGVNGQGCDPFIRQDICNKNPDGTDPAVVGEKTGARQDPQAEGPIAQKKCFDEQGVPLPVSFDYDTNFFTCTRLDSTDTTLDSCEKAIAAKSGGIADKDAYFCDMRLLGDNKLHPHWCKPNPDKYTSEEVLESNKVVKYTIKNNTSLTVLDRCTLDLDMKNGVKGTYATRRGCIAREGYMMKPAPFWAADPSAQVAVCAIEAQERATNPWTMESCETARFRGDRTCGCGAGMRRCEVAAVHTSRVAAINEEPDLITDSVVRNDEPYFNILTTRRSFVNGPLSQFYRQQQGVNVFSITSPANPDTIPSVGYAQEDTWQEYTRDAQHSGVLSTPSFLYRFPTQRARVNHFYEAFLCKTFVPSSDPLPPPEDNCNRENNLAKRCGCNYCHATIEPTGAHWGRYDERNALFLNPERFPRYDPKCRDCALAGDTNCGGECSQYVMQAYDGDGANSLGMLKTYLYRTSDEEANIQGGPQLLVERMLQTGDLERCTVKRIWTEFLGRPMSTEEQQMYLQDLSEDFSHSNYSLKTLIQKMLMTDAYRRID
ncbi:DUF1585 domain-containing protein [Hyalangium versicolor]|uniref:DUF1585 domain-containing protein n=1 Tax=Hyalangium versicolor TaxID=2861190 RepID=UPI0028149E58|nr:DUF1585 domain-containing protein [Hyalangium versicolor]